MGGHALSVTSVRLSRAAYGQLADTVVARLREALPGSRVYAIESYRAKADFGDLDVLVESTGYDPLAAARALGAVEVVRNGTVTSIGLRMRPEVEVLEGNLFQVDLIATPPEAFDFASCYFRNSDMGNLMGRIAHKLGTSLRHDGLVYHCRDGDHKFRTIVLTRDFSQALAFLGYDAPRYFEGFEDLEEIFRYVSGTEFFSRDIYLLENRNAQSRVRDRKRPTYTAFLQWCEARSGLTAFEMPADKAAWLGRIVEHFPGFAAEHEQAQHDLARQRAVKAKFNGEWVSQLTGLQGKGLGRLMRQLKESFESAEALQAFVLEASAAELATWVRAQTAAGPAFPG